jgi:hypothetical protein
MSKRTKEKFPYDEDKPNDLTCLLLIVATALVWLSVIYLGAGGSSL